MSEHLKIEPLNETFVKLRCRQDILRELSEQFTFVVPNAKFMPAYKTGIWDGKIRLVDYRNKTIYKGLLPHIVEFCRGRNYKISISKEIVEPFKKKVEFNWNDLSLPDDIKEIRDFQEKGVNICLSRKRQLILSSTGSGKSLIIYALARALAPKKTLIIVSTKSLLQQMYNDFDEYSKDDPNWSAEDNVHLIFQGQSPHTEKHVVISTWQSLQRKSKGYLGQFGVVIADEVHEFDANVTKTIVERAHNAFYRFGFTGTLRDSKTHELTLTGLFGPPTRISETKDLIDRGILSSLKVQCIVLKHNKKDADSIRIRDDKGRLKNAPYTKEALFLMESKRRNKFLSNLASTLKGNSLILFNEVENHGKPLYDMIKEQCKDKKVFFVYSNTSDTERERIRKLCSTYSNVVILATYRLFSQGINIKRLENIVMGIPVKSRVRVLQSIGRGLRIAQDKKRATIYDISDDLRGGRKAQNHTLKHFIERYNLYLEEGFDVQVREYKL